MNKDDHYFKLSIDVAQFQNQGDSERTGVENWVQISDFLPNPVKITGGMNKMFEWIFVLRPGPNPDKLLAEAALRAEKLGIRQRR